MLDPGDSDALKAARDSIPGDLYSWSASGNANAAADALRRCHAPEAAALADQADALARQIADLYSWAE